MMRAATILVVALNAFLFWAFVPLSRLVEAFPSMTVALSVMSAAILVRLNRGMPTLDWKSLQPHERRRLTKRILQITGEYVVVLATVATLLVGLVSLTVAGKAVMFGTKDTEGWPENAQRSVALVIGCLSALTLLRMGYVVWRDYDIVRLQRVLLDEAGVREERETEVAVADRRMSDIRNARVATVPVPPPEEWEGGKPVRLPEN